MQKDFKVSIYTPSQTIFDANAVLMVLPGELGYLGVLADHAPFITSTVKGKITLCDAYGRATVLDSKGKGFFEVKDNKAVLLLEAVS